MASNNNFVRLSEILGLKFGPVRKGVTPKKVLEYVLNEMVMTQTDNGLANDADALCRFSGMTEAYKNVAHFIAPSKKIDILTEPAVLSATQAAMKNGAKNGVKMASNGA